MRTRPCTAAPIIGIRTRVDAGPKVGDVCRHQGIRDATDSRGKAQDGGVTVRAVRRLRSREEEDRQVKQSVADRTLDPRARKEIATQNG